MSSTFDMMVETFRAAGLSPQAARIAAIGRDHFTEADARLYHDRQDRLREAEDAATAAMLAPTGQAPDLATETVAVMEAARRQLGMDEPSARRYALGLLEREVRRGGREHAARWQKAFAVALVEKAAA